MDGYELAYVAHNVPFVVIAGLETSASISSDIDSHAFRIASDIPCVDTEDSKVLLKHFKGRDGDGLAWNAKEYNGRNKFKIMTIKRVFKPAANSFLSVTETLIGLCFAASKCTITRAIRKTSSVSRS